MMHDRTDVNYFSVSRSRFQGLSFRVSEHSGRSALSGGLIVLPLCSRRGEQLAPFGSAFKLPHEVCAQPGSCYDFADANRSLLSRGTKTY